MAFVITGEVEEGAPFWLAAQVVGPDGALIVQSQVEPTGVQWFVYDELSATADTAVFTSTEVAATTVVPGTGGQTLIHDTPVADGFWDGPGGSAGNGHNLIVQVDPGAAQANFSMDAGKTYRVEVRIDTGSSNYRTITVVGRVTVPSLYTT